MLRFLLAFSLVANAVLVSVLWRAETPKAVVAAGFPSVMPAATEDRVTATPGSAVSPAKEDPAAKAVVALAWSRQTPGDLPTLIARLRAAGFPEATIRAVVSGVLGMEYGARVREMTAGEPDAPHWQDARARRDPKVAEEIRKLGREHARILRELLGDEPLNEGDEAFRYRRNYGDLSPEKMARVRAIDRDYGDLLDDGRVWGLTLPGDRERAALLDREKNADLAAVLTPAELEQYQLRSSSTASFLRWQYAAFEPTEAEFRALYQAARVADEKLGPLGNSWSAETLKQRTDLMKDELGSALAPARLEEFAQLSDPHNQQTAKLVARLKLAASVTKEVVAIQKTAGERARVIHGDQNLDTDARRAALDQLARETSAELAGKLGGQRGLEAYKLNGGSWVDMLRSPRNGRPAPLTPGIRHQSR
jgi:hypothetical protein